MPILSSFIENARKNKKIVAIGLGKRLESIKNIIQVAQNVAKNTENRILLVGRPQTIQTAKPLLDELHSQLDYYAVDEPDIFLIESLFESKEITTMRNNKVEKIDAIVRGSLPSSPFVKALRKYKKQLPAELNDADTSASTYRLALLETYDGHQFFYSPVGIDEANSYQDKKNLLIETIKFFKKTPITPKIAILSGGRLGDIGRDSWIDENIEGVANITHKINKDFPDIDVQHYEILIEKAIADKANMILAPEGIAGNLIYRTLVHLGGGKSYGAIYLTYYNHLDKIVVDTSRVAPLNEYEGALYLALGI